MRPATRDKEAKWHKPAALPLTIDDQDWFACPRQDVRERPREWAVMLKYYAAYKNGFLPQDGAVAGQSNKAMELFRLLDIVNSECDSELADKATRNKGDPTQR